MSKQVVCVMGATGKQGGAVIDSLLKEGKFALRATSRDPTSAGSKKLRDRGVEIVKAHTADKASLINAFKGAYAVFAVTNFWDPSVATKEFEHGKNIVDAAKTAGVQVFIYSSLANSEKISGGRMKVDHFTLKGRVEEYARSVGFPFQTYLMPAFYYQNLQDMMPPTKGNDGVLNFAMGLKPETIHTMFDVRDIGPATAAVLNDPAKWNGRSVPLCGARMTLSQIADTFTLVTGMPARAVHVPVADLMQKNKEMGEMFQWFNEYEYYGPGADLKQCNSLCKLTTFEDWLRQTGWKGEALKQSD